MASSGTKDTGFCVDLGPYECGNCQKFERGLCLDNEVRNDPDVPKNLITPEGVKVDAKRVCCNEFLSKREPAKKSTGQKLKERMK